MAYRVPRYDEGRDYKPRSPLTVQLERLRHSMLGCIIALNVLVFLVLKILVLCGLEQPVNWTSLNGSFSHFVTKPWGLLTYMFVHIDVIHLLFNMMWLWAFGAIIMRFDGPKPLLRSYIFRASEVQYAFCLRPCQSLVHRIYTVPRRLFWALSHTRPCATDAKVYRWSSLVRYRYAG